MKKLVSYLPLLIGFTLSWTNFSLSNTDVSNIWTPMVGIITSMFDILLKFWPYLLLFAGWMFILKRLSNLLWFWTSEKQKRLEREQRESWQVQRWTPRK